MTLKNRLAQLEKNAGNKAALTWREFITGAKEPDPQAWADFLALARPSEILQRVNELLADDTPALTRIDGGTVAADDIARRVESLRAYVGGTDVNK